MPFFTFVIQGRAGLIPDIMGRDLPDLDAAHCKAVEIAADIGSKRLMKDRTSGLVIEIRNEHGQRLSMLTTSMHVDRVEPQAHRDDLLEFRKGQL